MHSSILHVELLNDIRDFCKMKEKIIETYNDILRDNNEEYKYYDILCSIVIYYEDLTTFGTAKCKDNENRNKLILLELMQKTLLKKNNLNILQLKNLFNRSLKCLTPEERQDFFDNYI